MKIIVFSPHSLEKIEALIHHNISINRELVENALKNPESVESGYKGRMVAQKTLDNTHVLRIV